MNNDEWLGKTIEAVKEQIQRLEADRKQFPPAWKRFHNETERLIGEYKKEMGSATDVKRTSFPGSLTLEIKQSLPHRSAVTLDPVAQLGIIRASYWKNGVRTTSDDFKVQADTDDSVVDRWIQQTLEKLFY